MITPERKEEILKTAKEFAAVTNNFFNGIVIRQKTQDEILFHFGGDVDAHTHTMISKIIQGEDIEGGQRYIDEIIASTEKELCRLVGWVPIGYNYNDLSDKGEKRNVNFLVYTDQTKKLIGFLRSLKEVDEQTRKQIIPEIMPGIDMFMSSVSEQFRDIYDGIEGKTYNSPEEKSEYTHSLQVDDMINGTTTCLETLVSEMDIVIEELKDLDMRPRITDRQIENINYVANNGDIDIYKAAQDKLFVGDLKKVFGISPLPFIPLQGLMEVCLDRELEFHTKKKAVQDIGEKIGDGLKVIRSVLTRIKHIGESEKKWGFYVWFFDTLIEEMELGVKKFRGAVLEAPSTINLDSQIREIVEDKIIRYEVTIQNLIKEKKEFLE